MREKPLSDLQKSPPYRTLMVLEAIGRHGPVSLNALCEILPVPRTAIWRAASTLRQFGWVRVRLADRAYELTSQCELTFSDSHVAHAACDIVAKELSALKKQGITVADAGAFVSTGKFILIESTQADSILGEPLSLIDDPHALAAQAAMPPQQLLRHLRAYQRTATPDKAELIQSGAHARTIMGLSQQQNAGQAKKPRLIPFDDDIVFLFVGRY